MKYISKFDYGNTIGYQVRLPIVINGVLQPYKLKTNNKFFAKKRGTWLACEKAALAWRDVQLKKDNISYLLKKQNNHKGPHITSTRNFSGIIGVHLVTDYKKSGEYDGYIGFYNVDGVQYKRTYSCNLYGYQEAFDMACKLRYENAGTLIVTDKTLIPFKLKYPFKRG